MVPRPHNFTKYMNKYMKMENHIGPYLPNDRKYR